MTGPAPDPTLSHSELSRMRTAARRGHVDEVARWTRETYWRLGDTPTGAAVAPRDVLDQIDEIGETARAVDISLHGTDQELADWLQAIWLDSRDAPPERRRAISDRIDRIWDAVSAAAATGRQRPPLEPDWARDGSTDAIDRLEITYRVRAMLHQPRSHFVFEATPAVLTQIGDVATVRILRSRVASIRWLLGENPGKWEVNRIAFLDAEGALVGYWDVESYPSKQVYKWLCDKGIPAEKVTGRETARDPIVEQWPQRV